METRAPRAFALAFLLLAGACHHAKAAPPAPTFHYRSQAHDWTLDKNWSSQLNGSDPAQGTDAIKLHLDGPGVVQVASTSGPADIAVMIFTAGKKPLAQARAGGTISSKVAPGDVFIVVHAAKGSGPGTVQLVASLASSPPVDTEAMGQELEQGKIIPPPPDNSTDLSLDDL